jgi:phosphate transport system substrate-binding protein
MRALVSILSFAAVAASAAAAAATLDPALPAYEPRPAAPPAGARYVLPDGTIRIACPNRGAGVAIEGFNALFARTHPGTRFRVEYNRLGNAVNLAPLIHGTTPFVPMGREANAIERASYRSAMGADPLYVKMSHGTLTSPRMTAGLAVYVHKDNPVHRLTMAQLERIFTTGAPGGDLTRWGQLGATGAWASRPIHTYGTPEASGYGDYMLANKWSNRPLAPGYEAFELAAQIVQRVGEDVYGIGFAGQGFATPSTRIVALAPSAEGPYMEGTEEEVASGRYPLDRTVDLAVRASADGAPDDPFVAEYLRLVLSREGQSIIAAEADGYVPLTAAQVASERARLGLDANARAGAAPAIHQRRDARALTVDLPRNRARKHDFDVAAATSDASDRGAYRIVADETMGPLVERLNQLYAELHPDARFTLTVHPPPAGIDGITAGVSLVAPVAHDAHETEIEPIKRLTGSAPLDIRIGRIGHVEHGRLNPPAVYVNAGSPLREIDLETLGRIFTAGSTSGDLRRWSQLGLGDEWAKHAIHLYGTRDDGGFITTLRAKLFAHRALAGHYEGLPADADVLQAVAADRYAIAIAGFVDPSKVPPQARMLALRDGNGTASLGGYDDVRDGRYPLAPHLHLYLRAGPGEPLDPVAKEYARVALSAQGQRAVADLRDAPQAYVPLSVDEARRELAKLQP